MLSRENDGEASCSEQRTMQRASAQPRQAAETLAPQPLEIGENPCPRWLCLALLGVRLFVPLAVSAGLWAALGTIIWWWVR
jgi:hypothetical protein